MNNEQWKRAFFLIFIFKKNLEWEDKKKKQAGMYMYFHEKVSKQASITCTCKI